jgi:hypothetical protein
MSGVVAAIIMFVISLAFFALILLGLDRIDKNTKKIVERLDWILDALKKRQ